MSTAAEVDIEVNDAGYFQEAFQFGEATDTSWSFTNKTFICEVKASRDDSVALMTFRTSNGRVVVDSDSERILHFFVSDDDIRTSLPPATYVYDLIMVDGDTNARTPLMFGNLTITRGVSLSD